MQTSDKGEDKSLPGVTGSESPAAAHPAEENDAEKPAAITQAEATSYGDETDVPIRRSTGKKKSKSTGGKTRKPPREPLFSEKRFRQKGSFFDLLNGNLKPRIDTKRRAILFFNHRISFPVVFALLIVVALGIMIFVDDNTITISEVTVPVAGLDTSLEGYRVLVISDLNGRSFGDGQTTLLNKLKNVKYDIVVILGDMVGNDGDAEPFLSLVDGLGASKVYFIPGDNDPGPIMKPVRNITGTLDQMVLEDWILAAVELGATYVDAPVAVKKDTGTVWLTPATLLNINASSFLKNQQDQEAQETGGMFSGLEEDYVSLPITCYRKQVAQEMYDTVPNMKSGDLHLCLAHEVPSDEVILASESHLFDDGKYLTIPDMILAGHYCGGVIRLPIIGALYAQSSVLPRYGWFPKDSDVCGLSALDDIRIYITRGLSTNGDVLMPFRVNNRPEISILTFQSTSSGSMLG